MEKITEINGIMGRAIRDGLHRKGMTQQELAEKVGSTQRSISSYVTGNTQPPLDILSSICIVLEINLNQILKIPDFHHPYRMVREKDELDLLSNLDHMDSKTRKDFIQAVVLIKRLLK